MVFGLHLDGREDMVRFGAMLMAALREHDPDHRYVISLSGDANSGKSLVALAADAAIHPERYPQGITQQHSVYDLRNADKRSGVYFSDGLAIEIVNNLGAGSDGDIAGGWEKFYEDHKNLKTIITSNIWTWSVVEVGEGARSVADPGKIRVDMDVNVRCVGEPSDFKRDVTLTVADPALEQRLQNVFLKPFCVRPGAATVPSDPGQNSLG